MEENRDFLEQQIITYIGNKRKLLGEIEALVSKAAASLNKDRLVCADLMSGSGIVARMLKKHSSRLIVNDLEEYSRVINECYLTNKEDFDIERYNNYKKIIDKALESPVSGVISENYAPENEDDIQADERVFYTPRNARYIDTVRRAIDGIDSEYQKFFLAPLLYEASVHANTSGVFKGFYKDKDTKKGKYGGTAENCLERIKAPIELKVPVFSDFSSEVTVYRKDVNELAGELHGIDVAYLDPPYNQHPYGSNYFMLNTIIKNEKGEKLSRVSGIPEDWNRSDYNKAGKILASLDDLIKNLDAKYIILSYNSEGFLKKEDIENILGKYGSFQCRSIQYNTFRGSRNLRNRNIYVNEYLFYLEKGDKQI